MADNCGAETMLTKVVSSCGGGEKDISCCL